MNNLIPIGIPGRNKTIAQIIEKVRCTITKSLSISVNKSFIMRHLVKLALWKKI